MNNLSTVRENVSEKVDSKFSSITLALFYAIGLTLYLDWFIIGALLIPIKNELNLPDEQLAMIGVVFFLASSFTTPVFGYLGDRFPRKPIMVAALALWNIAAIASGLTSSLLLLLIWRALVGLGQGCFETLQPGWLSDRFKPSAWSWVFGIVQSTAPVGAAIGFVAGSWLAAQISWHYAFVITGIPGLLLTFIFLFVREPRRGESEQNYSATSPASTLGETVRALTSPLFIIFLFAAVAFTTGLGGISTWGPSFLHRAYGLSNPDASSFFAIAWISAGFGGVVLGGWLGSLWRRRNQFAYPLMLLIGSGVATPALFIAFLAQNQAESQAFLLCEIFFASLGFGPITALLIDTVPVAQRSAAAAIYVVCAYGFANMISADLIGVISDRSTLRLAMLAVPSAFGISAILFLAYIVRKKLEATV